jgi:hypothetical protein
MGSYLPQQLLALGLEARIDNRAFLGGEAVFHFLTPVAHVSRFIAFHALFSMEIMPFISIH